VNLRLGQVIPIGLIYWSLSKN